MSSELLGAAQNVLKGNLGGAWDINKGYADAYTDLGIARRFGAAAAAYSLRDIGAMNGRVVKARRSEDDLEEDFSANQVQSGALEDWVNGKLESTLPADVATAAAAYSLRKVRADYANDAVRIRRSSDDIEVDVAFDSDNKVSASSAITNVAEQGGESGQTTDTTLGDFISGTDAFVHTWYDQAGSNDAVQDTAANQPKIASSGALLADGLDFDGSNDELETGANITGSTINGFVVANLDGTDGKSLYSVGDTKPNVLFGDPSLAYAINGGTSLSGGTAPTLRDTLFTSLFISGGTSKGFINAVEVSSGSAGSNSASSDKLTIGNLESSDRFMNGSMKELILYTSDQSDNRFKIESNINNYYGLYNDANEFSANPTSAQSSVTLSNVSKTGFTATIDATSETKQVAFPFVNDLVSGDDYFVSFDYTTSDSSKTVSVKPFQSAGGSNASNDTISATSTGFYGGTGDASHNGFDVNATATVLVFQTTGTSFNFTVSNLRVSRIARNGFVETWYDQSGNGNDATQGSAGNQPAIVKNGGLSSDGIEFDGSNDLLGLTSALGATTTQSIFAVQKNDVTTGGTLLFDNRDANDDGSAIFATDTVGNKQASWDAVDAEHTASTNEELISLIKTSSAIKIRVNAVEEDSTASSSTIDISNAPKIGASFSSGNHYDGSIKELICYNSDTSSDVSDIENDINNYYDIY